MASQGKRMVPEALIKKLQDFSNNGLAALTAGNITTLTTNQINSLKCGDIVCKEDSTGKHAYIVSYKKDGTGICLTYADASVVETVSYDYSGSAWVYNSTDITNINTVVANPTLAGTEANLAGLQVGDTKYAMPHLYEYYMHYSIGDDNIYCNVISTKDIDFTTITIDKIFELLGEKTHSASGIVDYGDTDYAVVYGIYCDDTDVFMLGSISNADNDNLQTGISDIFDGSLPSVLDWTIKKVQLF